MPKRPYSYDPVFLCNLSSCTAFLFALASYWFTADSGVSYWDCPEYVVTASRLEVGHPPGNPIWTLAMRFITIPFPTESHAYVINLASGFFMAMAVFFLARIIFTFAHWCCRTSPKLMNRPATSKNLAAATAAFGGSLVFAFCDSTWFSAVEAEVYAMSAFMTALSIWLMTIWGKEKDSKRKNRLLILIAYIMGLSLGVHQLNLLCIPVLALIAVFSSRIRKSSGIATSIAIVSSMIAVAMILTGLMHGSLTCAESMELFAVNKLHLPYFSGAIAYCALVAVVFVCAVSALSYGKKWIAAASAAIFFFLSGIFSIGDSLIAGAVLSTISAVAIIAIPFVRDRIAPVALWSVALMLAGYASFAVILIRGNANPPMNEASPSDVFALHRYISRSQYGSKPLLYGSTPFSRPLLQEEIDSAGSATYKKYILKKGRPLYVPYNGNPPRLNHRSGFFSATDSAFNADAVSSRNGYIKADYIFSTVTTPELDMWFPRITSASPGMMESYEAWAGMTTKNMSRVPVSETIRPDGTPDAKSDCEGNRIKREGLKPTYLQNLRMFLTYQAGYMYFRYLMWNFMGRQNDIPSTGEIDHGNFITGVPAIDDIMLGPAHLMPHGTANDNPGHNVYYGLPFLIGIIGIIWLCRNGRQSKRALSIVFLLFLMTGLAIVVYLNQSPGEPRERDYSFLGSFMAFSTWIAFGFLAWMLQALKIKNKMARTATALLLPAITVGIMWGENFDDHNRRGRNQTAFYAENILESCPEKSIVFTKGDNFTFPLWYVSETGGNARGQTVVDISYLATPEYAVNLMKLGDKGVDFTATSADLAYGAYAFTRIAKDACQKPFPAIQALRELYSQKEGYPSFNHSNLFIPRNNADTIFINLTTLAGGAGIPFRKLMLLDIAATNFSKPTPRPMCFLTTTGGDFKRMFGNKTVVSAFADILLPDSCPEYIDSVEENLIRKCSDATAGNQGVRPYLEPVITDQARRQRGAILRIARKRYANGETAGAIAAVESADAAFPYSEISPGSFTVSDSTFAEGLEYISLLLDFKKTTGEERFDRKATSLLENMKKRSESWMQFRKSLPSWRRNALSSEAKREIIWIKKIDSLMDVAKNKTK